MISLIKEKYYKIFYNKESPKKFNLVVTKKNVVL
jgi:hypothetical protein